MIQSENPKRGLSRPNALRDITLVALPIIALGATGTIIGLSTITGGVVVNLGYVLAIVFGGYLLSRQGSSWFEIGMARPASWPLTAISGLGACIGAIAVFVLAQGLIIGVLSAVGATIPGLDESRFNPIEENLPLFTLMIILAWTTIALGEELFYRAFLISRLIDHAGMGKGLAVMISSIIFGLVHFAEGPIGIAANGAFALLFGWIYIRSGRNLWITYIAHGLLNTFRFTLLYTGAA